MSQPAAELPGYLRFAWMFFMQPIRLHRHLEACGFAKPDSTSAKLVSASDPGRSIKFQYLRRLAFLLWVATPVIAVSVAGCVKAAGIEIHWMSLAMGVALGVAGGMAFGITVGVALGVTVGVAFGVALGVAFGMTSGGTLGGAMGVTGGITFGIALGVAAEVLGGVAFGASLTILGGVAVGVVSAVVFAGTGGAAEGAVVPMVAGMAAAVTVLRLPLWPIEALLQVVLFRFRRSFSGNGLHYSSVHWHELSHLPIPFLGQHIEATAELDLDLARRTLNACALVPGQHKVGQQALANLQGQELSQIARDGRFRVFIDEETTWLPPEESAHRVIEQFRQTARFLVAAEGSGFAHHRREHLRSAEKSLAGAEVQLLEAGARTDFALRQSLPAWRATLTRRQADAERDIALVLPVPFRSGEPLNPERGREVFRGREHSISEIEEHLALSTESCSVVLLGPRRTGKSSLLRMLPLMLPDAICVFFDLQGHPVETPAGFFQALAKATCEQARRSRKVILPDLPSGPAFESAAVWIQLLEEELGDRRLLICIDEYEALETSFGDSRPDRLRLMGLLRSTIQHSRSVRLLVSGEAPFDELDPMWDAHFVSAREVRLGHLETEVAVDLVRRPISEFPDDAIPEKVARLLVHRAGAQPFLVQLLAKLLVSLLNEYGRRSATLADLASVERDALGQVGYYFRDLWNRAPLSAREVLAGLARRERPEVSRAARRWLKRRCLLGEGETLAIPIFGRFLREEILD